VSELTACSVKLGMLKLTSNILEEIIEGRKMDLYLVDWIVSVNQGNEVDFGLDESGILRFRGRVCVLWFG